MQTCDSFWMQVGGCFAMIAGIPTLIFGGIIGAVAVGAVCLAVLFPKRAETQAERLHGEGLPHDPDDSSDVKPLSGNRRPFNCLPEFLRPWGWTFHESLEGDEMFSLRVAVTDDALGIIRDDLVHPPLSASLLRPCIAIFGSDPSGIRALSLIAGLATVNL